MSYRTRKRGLAAFSPVNDSYRLGIMLAAAGETVLSFSGVVIRHVESATSWQIIFYRSIGLLTGLSILYAIRNAGRLKASFMASVPRALSVGPFQGLASIFFILALANTTIANAMLTLSATPLIAAVLGRIILRERVPVVTVLAMLGAVTAIAIMTYDGFNSGVGLGSLFAVANAFAFATYIVMLRRSSRFRRAGEFDMFPAVMVGAIVAGSISLIPIHSFNISAHDLVVCLFWGAGVQTVGVALMTTSARMIPAAELSIMVLLESIGGPIWAWLLIGELPGALTISGGVLMITVIVAWSLIRLSQEHHASAKSITLL
jgi:drug/metabolite transporter (DMT)-like permease